MDETFRWWRAICCCDYDILCFFYIVQKYFVNKISLVIIFVTLLTFIAYCFFPYKNEVGENGIYGSVTIFRWIPYFIIMLLGAWIGLNKRNGQLKVVTTWRDLFL